MPAMDYQGSSVPFAAIGRSILSIRRDQVHAVDGHGGGDSGSGGGRGQHHELELEAFQRRVADLFADLAASDAAADVLSLSWVRRLLDSFIICHEEFRSVLFGCGGGVRTRRPALARPPVERLVSDFFDRAVKALDVCNAIRDGVDQLRRWLHHLEIVIVSIGEGRRGPLGEGQVRRARKALTDLTILMLDEKETGAGTVVNHRNRSFGRSSKDTHHRRTGSGGGGGSHFRSLSWSVSRSWSAARQLQAMETNLSAPRGNELTATNGLAAPLYTMSSVLLFVMWALVAAIPCQDRGLQTHFSVPRTFQWAAPITSLHERILEESKKKDRKNSCGLLKEIHAIEKCSRQLTELLDPIELPLPEEKAAELKQAVEELTAVYDALKEGLEPLERQVREMFHRMVRSRTEGLDCLSRAHNPE